MAQSPPPTSPTLDADFQKLATVLDFIQARNARDYAITSPNAIDEAKYVELGGIEQWITIRGNDRNNPVVLFLHGGPGDATNPWSYAVFRSWLDGFTLVQWDQRGTGRTLGKNGSSSATGLTLDRLVGDGLELAELLRKSLAKEKIILVGHSFGSILGVMMAKKRPDLFYAYVGTGQVADPSRSYTVAWRELLEKAEARGDARALAELKQAGPPPYSDGRGYAIQRRWANTFEGADFFIFSMLGLALTAPGYTVSDVNDWLDGQVSSAEALVPQTSKLDAALLSGDFAVPVLAIQGVDDFTTPTSLVRTWLDSIRAPRKDLIVVEGGGHFAVFTKSETFLRKLEEWVLPLVLARGEDALE